MENSTCMICMEPVKSVYTDTKGITGHKNCIKWGRPPKKDIPDINTLYRKIIVDLVTLAIKSNDVVIQGSFAGSISDEVNSLLALCNRIKKEYVVNDSEQERSDYVADSE